MKENLDSTNTQSLITTVTLTKKHIPSLKDETYELRNISQHRWTRLPPIQKETLAMPNKESSISNNNSLVFTEHPDSLSLLDICGNMALISLISWTEVQTLTTC